MDKDKDLDNDTDTDMDTDLKLKLEYCCKIYSIYGAIIPIVHYL
jgi:hypothetical protein